MKRIALLVLLPLTATADEGGMGIDAQIFKPALDTFGVFSTESARGPAKWDFGLRALVGFAAKPLHIASEHTASDEVLESQLTLDFGISFGISERLTFAFDVPLQLQPLGAGYGVDGPYCVFDDPMKACSVPTSDDMLQPGTGFFSVRPDQNLAPSEQSPGDPRVALKLRLTREGSKLGLALQAIVHVPFGDEDVFAGSEGFTYEPKLIAELEVGRRGMLALNAGARIRKGVLAQTRRVTAEGKVMNDEAGLPVYQPHLYVGTEGVVSLAGRFGLGRRLALAAEAYALIPIAKADSADCPDGCRNGDLAADVLGGLFLALTDDTTVSVAGGLGLVSSAARHDGFRVVGAVSWAPSAEGAGRLGADRDGDGIGDREDICPDEREDRDGFQDDDGCPDPDNDLDGVADGADRCPTDAEDKDGTADADGCPDIDDDGDGVADLNDRCAKEKEDADGFEDGDGCPDPDNDGDGILDVKDKCANEPETVNGVDDADGCPDQTVQGGPRMSADRIDLQGERVEFVGRTVRLAAGSQRTLEGVAQVMKSYPQVRIRVEVAVELSSLSKRAKAADKRLSAQRAKVVQAFLLARGVKPAQLDVEPLGSDRPLDPKNPKDPRANRRVDFIRVTQ